MTAQEEQEYWRRLVDDLNEKFTLEYLAREFGVSERQVSNWKSGDRPKGLTAIKVYTFHMKHRTQVQESGTEVHYEIKGTSILSEG